MGKPKNRRPDLNGLLVVDKPLGMGSTTVVRKIRRITNGAKVGHAGTLDPLATGVLIVCIGQGTKSVDSFMNAEKVYETQVDLTAFTNTDDREGEREEITVNHPPLLETIQSVIPKFIGEIKQTPSAFSAIHINGVRAYLLARQGEEVKMPERTVTIHDIEILNYEWPILSLRVRCGKGTYIRSLGRDIGKALGTGGHLASLRRTRIGKYDLSMAITEERMESDFVQEDLIEVSD